MSEQEVTNEEFETDEPSAKASAPILDRQRALEALQTRLSRVRERYPARAYETIAATPARYLGQRLRAHLGEASPRMAIKAQCEACVGHEDVRSQVGDCKAYVCPLWTYRPYQAGHVD